MTVPNPTPVRRTKDECIRRAGKALADERAAQAARTVEAAALAAYRPEFGGPSLSELEDMIRAHRGLAVAA
ncbi:hypothetical protein ACFWGN_17980 [Oerskovia sp. NPDC060338]|uniref:hypothetical protein n=1 Tax=Oerskovia sp. NPDC060338 TaxID=3347100 RepID=UPI00364C2423